MKTGDLGAIQGAASNCQERAVDKIAAQTSTSTSTSAVSEVSKPANHPQFEARRGKTLNALAACDGFESAYGMTVQNAASIDCIILFY